MTPRESNLNTHKDRLDCFVLGHIIFMQLFFDLAVFAAHSNFAARLLNGQENLFYNSHKLQHYVAWSGWRKHLFAGCVDALGGWTHSKHWLLLRVLRYGCRDLLDFVQDTCVALRHVPDTPHPQNMGLPGPY